METLKKSQDFKRALKGGSRKKLENIIVCALPNPGGPTRIGISVNRRAGGSVVRNRIKRRIREAIRKNASLLPQEVDMVILAGIKCYNAEFGEIERDIKDFIRAWNEKSEGKGKSA